MHTLRNWTAKRAGGRITVYGEDDSGASTKVVGVDRIEVLHFADRSSVIATDKDGQRHELLV
jgi:hypothetical protein